ncbi:hypothetical protein PMAYCL1PPCAC_07814 [Pristionchus mayeri]|uniref:Uncharacterized protein n=1 Tax=Pristionchus mayeri TaxID=1317129 RepID=A0AAN4ZDN5_9BILA|nr:hypothetical protein PMAYCL1PPCAC_07814 [Pristionchus mayeri]
MNCPCCRTERLQNLITVTMTDDDCIEAKIEPPKLPHRRPLIPRTTSRLWPPSREKTRIFIESLRFNWAHDRVFEFTAYVLMLSYVILFREFFSIFRSNLKIKDHADCFCFWLTSGMAYFWYLAIISHFIFIGYGWGFTSQDSEEKNGSTEGTWSRRCLFHLIVVNLLRMALKMKERSEGETLCIMSEVSLIVTSLLTLSFGVNDASLLKRKRLKKAEDEGKMRRRIFAELRAREEGVYVPMRVEKNEGDARREKKYLRNRGLVL